MKTFFLIIAFLAIVFESLAAGPLPIMNGVLQSDLNAGGHAITNATDLTDANGNSLLAGSGGGITLSQAQAISNTTSNWLWQSNVFILSLSNIAFQSQFAVKTLASETNNGLQATNDFLRGEWLSQQQEGVSRLPPLAIAGWFGSFDNGAWTNTTAGVHGISNSLYDASQTLYPFGYRYLLLDDGWGNTNLGANGLEQLSYSLQATFGTGTAGVANFINTIHTGTNGMPGWKLGVYLDGGTGLSTGGFQHGIGGGILQTNIGTLGRYGLDFLKQDSFEFELEQTASVIGNNGYPIYFTGAEQFGDGPLPAIYPAMMNSWRSVSGGDITSYAQLIRWTDVAMTNSWWHWVKPGHFIDMDYIGGASSNGGGTLANRTHLMICALFSAPIEDDAGFFNAGAFYIPLFTNSAVLAIDQDPAVICARRYFRTNNCDVYVKPLGSPAGPQFALGVVNRGAPATNVTLNFTNLYPLFASRSDKWSAYDCISNHWVLTNSLSFSVNVETNDCILWKIYPGFPPSTNTGDGSGLTNVPLALGQVAIGSNGATASTMLGLDGSGKVTTNAVPSGGGGSGNVTGPASSTDGNLVLFNGTTGTVISNSAFNPASFAARASNLSDLSSASISLANLHGAATNYGTTLEIRFSNGAFMRTNTAEPHYWRFENTNAIVTVGTNGVTLFTFGADGSITTSSGVTLDSLGGITGNKLFAGNFSANSGVYANTSLQLVPIATGAGVETNDNAGNFGYSTTVPASWIAPASPVTFADNTNGAIFELDASTIAGHSDGDLITNWTGHYSAQATNIGTAGNGPPQYKTGILNGLPVLRLYGTNRLVSTNIFGAISDTNLTVFIVAKHNLNPSLSVLLGCNGVKFYYGRTTPDCRIWNMQNLSPQTSKVGYSFLPWTNTTYTITLDCLVYDGTTVLCGDGLNMTALPNSGTIGMGGNPMEIGALGGSFNFTGDIGFIRIYTNTDPAIRVQAALHIAQTWGVNITNIPANIVVNGDSTAFGNGLSAGQDPASCLTNVLAAQWRTGNFYTENRGVGGQTFSNRLVLISDDIARIVPGGETIDLHLEGINDISAGMTSSNLEANVKLYGTQYRAAGGWFIPQKLIPRADAGFTSAFESNRVAFNAAIGTNYPTYADGLFDNSVLMPTSVTNTTVYMQSDKIHPTFTANRMLSIEEAKQIKKLDNKGALR